MLRKPAAGEHPQIENDLALDGGLFAGRFRMIPQAQFAVFDPSFQHSKFFESSRGRGQHIGFPLGRDDRPIQPPICIFNNAPSLSLMLRTVFLAALIQPFVASEVLP